MQHVIHLIPGPFRWWVAPLSLAGSMVLLVGISGIGLSAEIGQMALFTGYLLLATGIAVLFARHAPGRALGIAPTEHPLRIIVIAVLAAGATSLIATIGGYFSPDITQSTDKLLTDMGLGNGELTDFLLIVTICCLAPLGEEAVFRGLVFKGIYDPLRRARGILAQPWIAFLIAAIIAAILFAQSHGGEGQESSVVLAIGIAGMIFALCYALTGSLRAAVMAHSFNNTLELAGTVFGAEQVSGLNKLAILLMPVLTWGLLWLWGNLMRR